MKALYYEGTTTTKRIVQALPLLLTHCVVQAIPGNQNRFRVNGSKKDDSELAKYNPRGTMPAILDGDFVLWESHAIMIYLCEKYGWDDLLPSDIRTRSLVHQYLHFHHRNIRELTITWSRTIWPSVFGKKDPSDEWFKRNTWPGLVNNEDVQKMSLDVVEGMLCANTFITGEVATIADIAAYEELGQSQAKYCNLIDYSSYPSIRCWLTLMETLPKHAEAHQLLTILGDVSRITGGMKTVARANKQAAETINKTAAAAVASRSAL